MVHHRNVDTAYPSITVFLHFPKTAGSTLLWILQNRFPKRVTFLTKPDQMDFGLEELRRLGPAARDRLELVAGHMPFGVHELFTRPVRYFTFLRDPIERTVSDYYFVRRQPASHYLQEKANSLSLPNYLEYRASIARDNVQTRLMSGLWDSVPFQEDNRSMLQQAKDNIMLHAVFVGLTERFDESLLMLKRLINLRSTYYVPENVTVSRPKVHNLPRATIETIVYYNKLDIELYEFGQRLFEKQVSQYGASFRDDLRAFERRNKVVGVVLRPYTQLRRRTGKTVAKTAAMIESCTAKKRQLGDRA